MAGALPPNAYDQEVVHRLVREWVGGDRRVDRTLHRIYGSSAIERRFSVLDDFLTESGPSLHRAEDGGLRRASTGERNARYAALAPALAAGAAEAALRQVPELDRGRVTHLVTVSCTGFHAPGTDDHLIRTLGLRRDVARTHVGFMGCSAALPALRLAHDACAADADAIALVVAVELCTLHLQPSHDISSLLSTSVFGDGAAAAVVAARDLAGAQRPLELVTFTSRLCDAGRDDMAWTIGDHGFDMLLSPEVPRALSAELGEAVEPLLRVAGGDARSIRHWAVHPGGRAILDRVEGALDLPGGALAASRTVLAEAGNMSSSTVLFILEQLVTPAGAGAAPWSVAAGRQAGDARADAAPLAAPGDLVAALAFGPGLTVDGALLRAV